MVCQIFFCLCFHHYFQLIALVSSESPNFLIDVLELKALPGRPFSESQTERLPAAIFVHFDSARPPRDGDLLSHTKFISALIAPLNLIIDGYITDKTPSQRVTDKVMSHLPNLLGWVECGHVERVVENPQVPTMMRRNCGR